MCEEDEEEVFCGEEDVGGSNRNEAELIRLVSQNSILYNKKTDGYMNADKKARIWARLYLPLVSIFLEKSLVFEVMLLTHSSCVQ